MEQQELKVGFLNQFTKHWVGGVTYFKNLFQAMTTTESPRLIPYIHQPADECGECLLPYVKLFPEKEYPADPQILPKASDYQVDILSHLNDYQVSKGGDGIAWIADFQHLHLPEMFDEKELAYRNRAFHTLIEQNRIVCLSSYDAVDDFKKYAPEFAYKARCLHFVSIPESGVFQFTEEEKAGIRSKRQLPERYFYVPNQFWKHKNHIVVLQAIALLKKAGCPIHVVFSGNTSDFRFPHYFEELEEFCRKEQIEENVHFLGLIPLKEVYFLMRDCLALINPSKFEGWSSSVEEAKSIGKTIILSNLNVHYEQMPPNGIYFPVDDPVWLADLLKRAWGELKMGPDLAMESKAQEELPRRIQQFGKDFQQIVLDALENKNSSESALRAAPDITVVTVIRDLSNPSAKEQLRRNMASVAAQKAVAVEHLLIDGSSSGDVRAFLQPLLENFRCRLISESAHGMYGAMNLGMIHAKGKYIAFLDQESSYLSEEFLTKSYRKLENGNFDFTYPQTEFEETDFEALMPLDCQVMLFLRKALCHVAGFNDTLRCAAAYDLLFRLISAGKRGIPADFDSSFIAAKNSASMDKDLMLRECGRIFSRFCRKTDFINGLLAGRPELQEESGSQTPVQESAAEPEKMPQLSVILPLAREARFLAERIDSIRRQNFEDYEVIAVDSGVQNESMELVQKWLEEDKRVHLYRHAGKPWNFGLSQARGQYIYFAVSDCTMAEECFAHMAAALNEYPECAICDSRLQLIDQQGNILSGVNEADRYFGHLSYPADRKHVRQDPYDFLLAVCGKKVYTSLSQLMVRRELFALTGDFPEDAGNSADYLWSLFASFHANVVYLPEYLSAMRLNLNPQNLSDGICWDFEEINQCVRRFLEKMPESEIKTAACGLATLLCFKQILLPLKSPLSFFRKLSCYAKALKAFPKKSLELAFYMIKFHFRRGGGSTSIRANNALISSRMKKYQWLIRYGKIILHANPAEQRGE